MTATPVTIEEIAKRRIPANPRISPDGAAVRRSTGTTVKDRDPRRHRDDAPG